MNDNSEKYHLWITDNYENSDINKFEVKKRQSKVACACNNSTLYGLWKHTILNVIIFNTLI